MSWRACTGGSRSSRVFRPRSAGETRQDPRSCRHAIADGRRRERYCSNGCGHWWHRLSAAD
ncbi:DUF5958 family protein [Streptomyces sp. NPDC001020]